MGSMAPGLGQEPKKARKQPALFNHTNQTFISKSQDSASSTPYIFSGFASTDGGADRTAATKRPSKPPPSPIPTFSFSAPIHPNSATAAPASKTWSSSMDSITDAMSSLGLPADLRKRASGHASPASSSASLSTDAGDATSQLGSARTTDSDISSEDESAFDTHLELLKRRPELDELKEIMTTPIFTEAVRKHALALSANSKEKPFTQYGLLGGDLTGATDEGAADPRIFWNVAAPSSFFICGSQGSGKSHTLSCLLENALAPCKANVLPRPLTGIVFHYDTFTSDSGGSPCEAAWLSSNPSIKVRVLCPPTNIRTLKVILSCSHTWSCSSILSCHSESTKIFPTSALRSCASKNPTSTPGGCST